MEDTSQLLNGVLHEKLIISIGQCHLQRETDISILLNGGQSEEHIISIIQ